ncbi:hypothetical protein [Calidifontibacter terrae]
MKVWLVPVLLVTAIAWMLWAQSRLQRNVLEFLVARAGGSARRGAAWTHATQGGAAALAVLAIAAAITVELRGGLVPVRVVLMVAVLGAYVPFAATLGRTKLRKLRTPVERRLMQAGAPSDVALAIARAGRPWSLVGSLLMLAAVLVLCWHHLKGQS